MNRVKINGIYKHFKGDSYIVLDIGLDSETLEKVVIYRSLYENGTIWVRPMESFMREVDHKKYPGVKQKYCFQLQKIKSVRKKDN